MSAHGEGEGGSGSGSEPWKGPETASLCWRGVRLLLQRFACGLAVGSLEIAGKRVRGVVVLRKERVETADQSAHGTPQRGLPNSPSMFDT